MTHFRSLEQKSKNNFVRFLVQKRTRKFAFEINWPLAAGTLLGQSHFESAIEFPFICDFDRYIFLEKDLDRYEVKLCCTKIQLLLQKSFGHILQPTSSLSYSLTTHTILWSYAGNFYCTTDSSPKFYITFSIYLMLKKVWEDNYQSIIPTSLILFG